MSLNEEKTAEKSPKIAPYHRFLRVNTPSRLNKFAYFFGSNRLCNADEKRTRTKKENKKAK